MGKAKRAHHLLNTTRVKGGLASLSPPYKSRSTPQIGFNTTRNPSRGFGIGHICQSGL